MPIKIKSVSMQAQIFKFKMTKTILTAWLQSWHKVVAELNDTLDQVVFVVKLLRNIVYFDKQWQQQNAFSTLTEIEIAFYYICK